MQSPVARADNKRSSNTKFVEKNTRKATPSSSVMTSKASTAHNTTCLKSPAVGMVTPKRAGILAQPSTGSATQSDRKRKSVVFTTVDLCDEESSSDGMAFSAPVQPSDTTTKVKTSSSCVQKKDGKKFFTSPRGKAQSADKEMPAFPYRSGKIVLKCSPKPKAGSAASRSKQASDLSWFDDDVFGFHAED